VAADPDCLFCKIVAGELPAAKVDEDELVIPREHFRDLHEVPRDDLCATVAAAQRLAARARDRLDADGVNLLNSCGRAAWQTVFHFHVHVIPRYDGDPLRLPWLPEPGDEAEITAAAAALRGG